MKRNQKRMLLTRAVALGNLIGKHIQSILAIYQILSYYLLAVSNCEGYQYNNFALHVNNIIHLPVNKKRPEGLFIWKEVITLLGGGVIFYLL